MDFFWDVQEVFQIDLTNPGTKSVKGNHKAIINEGFH